MSVRRNDNPTASVSHAEKRNKKKRWLCFNTKSCIAMAVSAALLFTSVDSMAVRAEELTDLISPVAEEENPEAPEHREASGEFSYLKNDQGAVIIGSFQELPEKDSRIELEERKTLEEVCELMPKTLTANVTLVSSTGEDNGEPDEGEEKPDEGEKKPDEDEKRPDEGEEAGGGDTNPGEGEEQPSSGDNGDQGGAESQSAEEDANDVASAVMSGTFAQDSQRWRLLVETGESGTEPAEGEIGRTDNGAGDTTGGEGSGSEGDSAGGEGSGSEGDSTGGEGSGGEGDNTGGEGSGSEGDSTGGEGSGSEGDSTSGEGSGSEGDSTGGEGNGSEGDNIGGEESGSEGDSTGSEGGGSEGDSTGGEGSGSEGDNTGGEESGSEGDSTGGEESGNDGNEDGADSGIEDGNSDDTVSPETVEVEVPVTWECENYDTDKLTAYTFVPKWDEKEWFFEESEEHKIPTIEVVYAVPASEVSTEKELAAAFAAGFEKVVLNNDIALTKPLTLPADADIELDGGGYKLTRGKITAEGEESRSSETFPGIMINMNGEDYTEDTYGTLTLKNITVDGGTEADCAGAPAILNWGNLILDEGAVVKDNFNYGTYPREEDGETIHDYGGGIQVHRELTVSSDALVTENFADELGGGVYLAGGATLYLYADVIVHNSVGEGHGYGADLYAAPGSTIYYDPSIDMEREGFYICQGVTLIPMGIMETDLTDPTPADDRRELYIYVNDEGGYSGAQIAKLTDALREYGYTVLEGRTDIDTSDLKEWYVYDHYDENIWKSQAGWEAKYEKPSEKRGYYPYKSVGIATSETYKNGYYYFPTDTSKQVTTIKDWLESSAYGYGSNRYLAQFAEHIYARPENGSTMMTFVGYGEKPLVDFMYYDPESDGEKVVDFDVDSSIIDWHTMLGNGFLVNAGVDKTSKHMSGYVILYQQGYEYERDEEGKIISTKLKLYLKLYQIRQNISAAALHESYLTNVATEVASKDITDQWADKMSVQIRVTPNRIVVRQQPLDQGTDVSKAEKALDYEIPAGNVSGYSGFGPLVAYGSHSCYRASSFTYSDLRMYYTNPQLEGGNMLSALERADFTQAGTQKYFVDLFGSSAYYFADSVEEAQYLGYLKMMQTEGIALVTDRETMFGKYLGEADDPDSNLFELGKGGELPEPEELARRIHESIQDKSTTRLKWKVEQGLLTEAEPYQSVGNIWLQSLETGEQIRDLYESDFGGDTYQIQVIADGDIAYYYTGNENVTYEIMKPKAKDWETVGSGTGSSGCTISISKNKTAWPAGLYTVKQTIDNSGICGYAYFTLQWREAPIPTYTVTVTVRIDGGEWTDHGKDFMLQPKSGGDLIKPSGQVFAGMYSVMEQTKDGSLTDTGVSVEVPDADVSVTVDYYTVTFYDRELDDEDMKPYGDDTEQKLQIVLKDQYAARPALDPTRDKYAFIRWVTADGTEFDFDNSKIDKPTDIFAKWEKITYPVKVNVTAWKDNEEWNRQFKLRPEGGTDWIELSEAVPAGNYFVYDVTGLEEGASPTEVMNTGVLVEVEAAEEPDTVKEVKLEYYTVTFHDRESGDKDEKPYGDGTDQKPQIVLKDQYAARPAVNPARDKYAFVGWVTADGTGFDFDSRIDKPTEVYAKWEKIVAPRYKVTINARRDGEEWEDSGRIFALRLEEPAEDDDEVEDNVVDLEHVKNGTYRVYDISGAARSRAADTAVDVKVEDGDTGVTVTVRNENETAAVDYYTVTFYDGKKAYGTDTSQSPMIVLNGKKASEPSAPTKTGYRFIGWRTEAGGSAAFDFDRAITSKTDIYAGWKVVRSESEKEDEGDITGGGDSEDTQTVTVLQEASPQAMISQTESSPSEREPKTGDSTQVEIYATVAMIAGLTYLLLCFMEERRGMTEREKEVFVAAFIRWAKKGGRFRKCCAIAAIFCILVYYHSIGKRSGEKISREYLKQAL